LRVDCERLTPSSLRQFGFHLFDQTALLSVHEVFIEIRRIDGYESFSLAGLRIKRIAVQRA
jgi:hypothetical protein